MSANTDIARESMTIWNEIASDWDVGVGDGNKYWRRLQKPSLERLLADKFPPADSSSSSFSSSSPKALELACGNGIGARFLAHKGCQVTATDGTAGMVDVAKGRGGGVTFAGTLDVTSPEAFAPFIEGAASEPDGGFDIVLMNMAIMDVATLEPLAAALPKLLKKDGVFVATLLHPVFMTSIHHRIVQMHNNTEQAENHAILSKAITEYLHVSPTPAWAIPGQERLTYFFHRPIHELFTTFFKAGLVMDALEEPSFGKEDAMPERLMSTVNFTQQPAIMSFRLRRGS